MEERAVLTFISSVYESGLHGGSEYSGLAPRQHTVLPTGTPVVLIYIEEDPPETHCLRWHKKVNRSNNSREEGKNEVEMSN